MGRHLHPMSIASCTYLTVKHQDLEFLLVRGLGCAFGAAILNRGRHLASAVIQRWKVSKSND